MWEEVPHFLIKQNHLLKQPLAIPFLSRAGDLSGTLRKGWYSNFLS